MKRIILITLALIALLSLSAVQAAENATEEISADEVQEVLTDNATQKQDLNVEIKAHDYIIKHDPNDGSRTIELNNLPSDYNGYMSVYIDEKFITKRNDNYFDDAVNLRGYDIGKHLILVNIEGTEKYNPLTLTHEFEVTDGFIKIDETIKTNEGVHLELQEGATGYLTVNVDGKQFKKIKINAREYDISFASVSLGTLTPGIHSVEAIYSGDANNKKITKKASVNVVYEISIYITKPYAFSINGNYGNAYGSEFNVVEITLPGDAKAVPIANIDGVAFDVIHDEDTYYIINTSLLKPGEHILNVTYPGDSKYSKTTVTEKLRTVASIGTRFIDGYDYSFNNTVIYLNLPDDAKGNLSVFIDGELYKTSPVAKTGAAIPLSDVKLGKHTLNAAYTGSDYDVKNITANIDVTPRATYPKSMKYSSNETFFIEVDPDAKLTVEVRMDGKSFNLPLVDGKGNFSLSNLKLVDIGEDQYGHNEIYITYAGDYNGTKSYSIAVDPIPSRLVGASDITMYYGDSRTFTLTVWGSEGKIAGAGETVIVRLGSDYLYPKTDKNGIVKVKINKVPGTYKITATYRNAKVTKKVTVKQVLSLKSVSVKRSAKKLTLQATLKNKNAIKNKAVTFKFNGKTYKAKTNSKGVAKVTIKQSVLKKLKVGGKVTYQATYLKNTVKKTVKIQK
ncbi:hypothetical protein [uncultured Methanobrevibacter sp.]|uniref:hypothetical protein n=1 Tax=uncultured Methanobrevibacter sp. TaxID=253161 RepID=UPI00262E5BC3|nr:hypothetical protein [uncultured Methanobrevibacter sp.]